MGHWDEAGTCTGCARTCGTHVLARWARKEAWPGHGDDLQQREEQEHGGNRTWNKGTAARGERGEEEPRWASSWAPRLGRGHECAHPGHDPDGRLPATYTETTAATRGKTERRRREARLTGRAVGEDDHELGKALGEGDRGEVDAGLQARRRTKTCSGSSPAPRGITRGWSRRRSSFWTRSFVLGTTLATPTLRACPRGGSLERHLGKAAAA